MVTRSQLLTRATNAVMAKELKEFARGEIDQAWLTEMTKRRTPAIAATFLELARDASTPPARCGDCGQLATTKMAGKDYCDVHAAPHRKDDPR